MARHDGLKLGLPRKPYSREGARVSRDERVAGGAFRRQPFGIERSIRSEASKDFGLARVGKEIVLIEIDGQRRAGFGGRDARLHHVGSADMNERVTPLASELCKLGPHHWRDGRRQGGPAELAESGDARGRIAQADKQAELRVELCLRFESHLANAELAAERALRRVPGGHDHKVDGGDLRQRLQENAQPHRPPIAAAGGQGRRNHQNRFSRGPHSFGASAFT